MNKPTANILSIAGSDPSGGAGIQADLKTFAAHQSYGMAVITGLTAQNTKGVHDIHAVAPEFVGAQIDAIFDDIRVDAIKIGMLANADVARVVAGRLKDYKGPVVLDPVMVAKGGAPLLADEAVAVIRDELLSLATIVTPNLPEAAVLVGQDTAQDAQAIEAQGKAIRDLGAAAVLMKGGHGDHKESADFLISDRAAEWFQSPRIDTKNTHGTGCTLSSAIAAHLGRGADVRDAVAEAKTYIQAAIEQADRLDVGHGHGPVDHFHAWHKPSL